MPHITSHAQTMLEDKPVDAPASPEWPKSPIPVRRTYTLEERKRNAKIYFEESRKIADACIKNGYTVEQIFGVLDGESVPLARVARTRGLATSGPACVPIPQRTVHLGC